MSMRSTLRRPLRLFLRAGPGAAEEPTEGVADPPLPIVGLTLYAGDSLAFGYVPLAAGRVTDLLNEHEEFEFFDTHLESLEDGHGLELPTVAISRDEIFVVAVAGPRGDPKRRTRTRPIPVELRLGPYDVYGNIHVIPGTDPMSSFRRRTMVPITEATVEWDTPEGRKVAQWDTVVVNRPLTDWIAPARCDVRPADRQLIPETEGSGYPGELARSFVPR
jgi:hypothetical protein